MPFYNERYYAGRGVRWIIQDKNGKTPYCFCCGNFANGVGVVNIGKVEFSLPMCKAHVSSYMDKHTDKQWELNAPFAITINPRFL